MYQRLGDKKGTARAIYDVGVTYLLQGKWDEALREYQDALVIYREIGDKHGIADVFNVMGETYRWAGQLKEALGAYTRALELFKEMGARTGLAMCFNNLGATHLFAGDGEKALELLKQACAIHQEVLKIEGEPEALAYCSAAALETKRLDEALSFSDKALRVMHDRQFSEEDVQLVYYYRFRILECLGRTGEATAALRTAYENVMSQADDIKDEDARRGFFEVYPLRKDITRAWTTRANAASDG